MSSGFFLTFIVTVFVVAIILVTRRLHGRMSEDTSSGPQKFHDGPTPRIGGIAILIGLAVGIGLGEVSDRDFQFSAVILLLASLPAFAGGLLEDLVKRISVTSRLLLTFVSAAAGFIALDARITGVDIPGVDWLLALLQSLLLSHCLEVTRFSGRFSAWVTSRLRLVRFSDTFNLESFAVSKAVS